MHLLWSIGFASGKVTSLQADGILAGSNLNGHGDQLNVIRAFPSCGEISMQITQYGHNAYMLYLQAGS